MTKVVVLGGVGAVGSHSTRLLANSDIVDEVVIGDIDLEKAKVYAAQLGPKVSAVQVDAMNPDSIKKAIKGADAVLNTTGPFYKFEKTILTAVIESGINYVDICDDTGATYDALALDSLAKQKGVTAIIGMGSSPGVTNLLAAFCSQPPFLTETDSIDIFHAHGGEPTEGAGVIGHRFYCMRQDVPVFIDGKAKNLTQKEAESLIEEVEFINLKADGKLKVYPYPHPEPITMPMWIKGVKRVTNKGTVLPEQYYNLTRNVFGAGLDSKDPIQIKTQTLSGTITPYDFAIAYLIKRRDEIIKETKFGEQRGCVKIVVSGKNDRGLARTYIFSLVSEGAGKGQAMGEATGIPAAMGTLLVLQKKMKGTGVLPPEAALAPLDFLALMQKVLKLDKKDKKDKKKSSPVIIEKIDEKGNIELIDI